LVDEIANDVLEICVSQYILFDSERNSAGLEWE